MVDVDVDVDRRLRARSHIRRGGLRDHVGAQTHITIGLAKKDKEHLEKFKKAINCTKDLYFNKNTNSNTLQIYSKQLILNLLILGVHPNKSFTIKPWKGPFMPHYWWYF